MCSYANAAVDETSPKAGRLEVRVLLGAGYFDAPNLLPGIVQLQVDRVDARMVRCHSIAHVDRDSMVLDVKGTIGEKQVRKNWLLNQSSAL